MAAKKKYKRLTNTEKKFNKELKEKMVEDGIIPPKKKPLNRRKFAQEINKELKENSISSYDLMLALSFMRPSGEIKFKITNEEVGILKLCKIAIEYRKYVDDIRNKNDNAAITIGDIYENIIKPVKDL